MATHKNPKTQNQKRTATYLIAGAVTALMVLALVLTYLYYTAPTQYAPAKSASVEQTLKDTPADLKIGIIVSYTENAHEGRGWDLNGEGANVAKWRLTQGGTPVETIVVSDQGSENGAKEAIAELKKQKVSAILALTAGPHTQTLANAANEAHLPLLMPYAQTPENPTKNTWYGQETATAKTTATKELLAQLNCQDTLTETDLKPLLDAPLKAPTNNGANENTGNAAPSEKNENQEKTQQELTTLAGKLSEGNQTCILIENPATNSQMLLDQLALRNLTPTIILNQPVTNAHWLQKLKESNAYHTNLYTSGIPTSQLGQTHPNPSAKLNYAGFVEATQQMAADPKTPSFRLDTSFAQTGSYADTLSYDSFMAIVYAATQAKSSDPAEITKTLQSLQLADSETTLGRQLDFTKPTYTQATPLTLIELDNRLVWVESSNTTK